VEELELTFLPRSLPAGVASSPFKEITDLYVPASSAHPGLRIRKAGERLEITKKRPVEEGDASRQLETTISLTEAEHLALSRANGKLVAKRRHYYQEGGRTYEVDVFLGDLSGLVLVEIEFRSAAEKTAFAAPGWCLADVTQEDFIAGGMLAGKRYADIESRLGTFGYKKIELAI